MHRCVIQKNNGQELPGGKRGREGKSECKDSHEIWRGLKVPEVKHDTQANSTLNVHTYVSMRLN